MTEPVITVPKDMDGHQRFAKEAFIVHQTIPTMMQVLLNKMIPSQTLLNMAMANKPFIQRLDKMEQTMLKDLRNGYSNCSFMFLFKLVHMSNVLPESTSESQGGQSDRTVSMRDIDQLRIFRNELCHSTVANVSEKRFEHFFRTLISIGKRIDECCKSAFEKDIVQIMNMSLLDDKMDEYIKPIREIEEMKYRVSVGDTKIYYGKGIQHQLEILKNPEDIVPARVVIKLDTEDVTADMIQKINAFGDSLNTDTITFEGAKEGSIVFIVSVLWFRILGEEHFIQRIVFFLKQALEKANKKLEDYSTVVVFVDNEHVDIENLVSDRKIKRNGSPKRYDLSLLDDENVIAGLENTEDFILQGSKITSEETLFALVNKYLSDGSGGGVTVLVKPMGIENFLKLTDSDIESVRNKEVQIHAARSVGIIRGPISFGTGWRVGEHYVITAWHVVRENIGSNDDDITDNVQNENFNIEFNYKEENQFISTKFKFEKMVFVDYELDTAILKLLCNDNISPKDKEIPTEIKKFKKISPEDKRELCIIGHPAGKPQTVDSKVKTVKLTENDLQKAQQWSQQKFNITDSYKGINDPRFIIYNCYSTHGASGSVGIIIEKSHKEPVAVIMHIGGYPAFAYDNTLQVTENEKKELKEKGCILEVEKGVKLESVFKAMEAKQCELRHDIFGNQFR